MTINDYLHNNSIDEKTELTIVGTVKPRSIKNKASSLGMDFVLTDQRNELNCSFEGFTKGEFKEGETTLVKGYCPNLSNRLRLVITDYYTKHSMDTKEWEGKTNVARNAFGVQTYR
jgi:cytochrome c-type biogenesis protein CcmE